LLPFKIFGGEWYLGFQTCSFTKARLLLRNKLPFHCNILAHYLSTTLIICFFDSRQAQYAYGANPQEQTADTAYSGLFLSAKFVEVSPPESFGGCNLDISTTDLWRIVVAKQTK